MTNLLDNDLRTEVESSQTDAAQDRATHEAGCRDGRPVKERPEDRDPSHQADHLPTGQPDAGADGSNSHHQPRREPRG